MAEPSKFTKAVKALKYVFMIVIKTLRDIGDELMLMVAGAGIASLLLPALTSILKGKDVASSWKIAIINVAITILSFKFLIQLKVFKLKGGFSFHRSTLIIGILAFMLYASVTTIHNDFLQNDWLIITIITTLIYLSYRFINTLVSKIQASIGGKRDDERPITDSSQDKYWFKEYAKIAADKIINAKTSGVGLLGEYGCGKSSFANLMLKHFTSKDKFIRLKIDGWGLAEGGTVHYILNQIERELYMHTDTLRINRVPNCHGAGKMGQVWAG